MTAPPDHLPPPPPRTLLEVMTWQALYQAAQLENQSLTMRADALRASLAAIARGTENPCFSAARAISRDDDMIAACNITKGLHR